MESTRKILFVHGTLGLGGAEVLRLSTLQEMAARNWNVEVVVTRKAGELAEQVKELGIPLTLLGNRGGMLDLKGVRKLAGFIRECQPDIVQSSQFLTNLHTSLACRWAKHSRHIIEEHGIYTWKKWRHLLLDRWFNAKAAGVIACSGKVAESAAAQLRIPVDRIDVVHNCVSAQHLVPLSESWRTELARQKLRTELTGSDDAQHVTVIVGTLRWEKGHEVLLDAWEALTDQGHLTPEHHLLIVGDGPLKETLTQRSANHPNIHLLGSVSDTRRVLSAADLFVLPSVNEGFGIAIIEAMAAELPVISTTSGGIPEVVDDQCAVLVPPGNAQELAVAIKSLLDGQRDAVQMGQLGRQRVESRFTPTAYVDQLESIYQRLLGS